MAYDDEPEVDDNAIRSEDSVLAVRNVLNKRSGFICREETPDYGVDLDVELVSSNKGATSQKFAVQIKSTRKIKYIQKGGANYATFSFKTSRLAYLCNRPPAYGIIVLYEEGSKFALFDYVDAIVPHLEAHNPNWKEQETVTLHIPKQLLTTAAAKALHEKMTVRFQNHQLLLLSQGANYSIPALGSQASAKAWNANVDFNNPQQVRELLERYGTALLNEEQLDIVLHCLSILPSGLIRSSSRLLLLSALCYDRAGYVIETESYLRRCFLAPEEFTQNELELLEFVRLRTAYMKGELTGDEFSDALSNLSDRSDSKVNSINFRITIIYLKLIELVSHDVIDPSIKFKIRELYAVIDGADIDEETKILLKLHNSDNFQIFADQVMTKEGQKVKLQDKIGAGPSLEERKKSVLALVSLVEESSAYPFVVYAQYKESGNKRILAHALLSLARTFQNSQFTYMMLHIGETQQLIPGKDKLYHENEKAAINAHDYFLELNLFKEAHQALSIAHEIKMLYKLCFNLESNLIAIEDIKTRLVYLERELGIKPFESVVTHAFHTLNGKLSAPTKALWEYTNDEIHSMARKLLDAFGIPKDRIQNIIIDIRSHGIFEKFASGSGFQLFNDQNPASLKDMSEAYLRPPKFKLVHQKLGIESLPNSDVELLLRQFGLMPDK